MRKAIRSAIMQAIDVVDHVISPRYRLIPQQDAHTIPEQEVLRKLLSYFNVDCVFDVGANRGQYARMLREKVGYTGHIVSFEPIPDCASHLRSISSKDPKWHIEQVALSDSSGETTFNIMADTEFSSLSSPKSSDFDMTREGNRVKEVVKVTLDTVARKYSHFEERLHFARPFLKMDTQGNDIRVARGAGDTLHRFVALQSELAVIPIYDEMPTYLESIAFYESQGFRLSAFVPNNPGHFPRLVEVDCVMSNTRFLNKP